MPEGTMDLAPEPLPRELVRWGIYRQTLPLALYAALFSTGLYFVIEALFHVPQPIFALGYSIGSAFGWLLIVSSRNLWLWAVARRNMVDFRLLWELVYVYSNGPAAQYWGSRGQNRARIFREIEIERARSEPQGDEP